MVNREIPVGSEIGLFAGSHIHYEDAVLVALISIVLHREPRKLLATLGENGVGVVAHHALGEVAGGFLLDVVLIEVGIG